MAQQVAESPLWTEPARRPGPRRWRRRLQWAVLAAIVLGALAQSAHSHIAADRSREPLRAAQRAALATERPISTVPADKLTRWSSTGGPIESKAIAATGPGNGLLEPAFYNDSPPSTLGSPGDRCYFLVGSSDESFDASTVTTLARACYLGGSDQAYSFALRSVGRP